MALKLACTQRLPNGNTILYFADPDGPPPELVTDPTLLNAQIDAGKTLGEAASPDDIATALVAMHDAHREVSEAVSGLEARKEMTQASLDVLIDEHEVAAAAVEAKRAAESLEKTE